MPVKRIPKFLILESTDCCNLRCKGCYSTQSDFPKGFMDLDFYKSMVDSAAKDGLQDKTIIMTWANGEPMLHPKLLDMLQYTTSKGFKTYVTTNGMIWNEEIFHFMLTEPNYYQHIFSLDGLWNRGNVAKARPGSDEERIRRTIEGFLAMKTRLNSNLDVLVKIVERGQDFAEIEAYIDYWLRQEGIDCVVVGKMLNTFDTEGMRLFPCQYPDETFMLVRWDRTPTLCMYNPHMMNEQMRPMRKIEKGESILEYFNSEVYAQFHEDQERGIFRPPCNTCGIAYTGTGWRGQMHFRDPALTQQTIYTGVDYYNSTFSLVDKPRPASWYGPVKFDDAGSSRDWLK
jgi:organic radical activating enzyme